MIVILITSIKRYSPHYIVFSTTGKLPPLIPAGIEIPYASSISNGCPAATLLNV
jgi:hypothetical protein